MVRVQEETEEDALRVFVDRLTLPSVGPWETLYLMPVHLSGGLSTCDLEEVETWSCRVCEGGTVSSLR